MRLLFLQIVTKRHLDAKLGTLFSEGDEDGFILEVHNRAYIQMGENNDTVHSALDGVVSSKHHGPRHVYPSECCKRCTSQYCNGNG